MTNDEKTIETCTGEEITEALKLSEDATVAPWHRFNGDVVAIRTCIVALVPGTANPRRQVTSNVDHEPDAMFIARARTLLPKMAAHLAALKVACTKAREALTEAHVFIARAAEPEGSYGHYHGGDPRLFEPSEDECSAEEIANHKAACEAWARGERPDLPRACEPNREPITITDRETGEQRTIEAGTALALYAPFGIGLITYEPDEEAVRLRDAVAAALVDLGGQVQS